MTFKNNVQVNFGWKMTHDETGGGREFHIYPTGTMFNNETEFKDEGIKLSRGGEIDIKSIKELTVNGTTQFQNPVELISKTTGVYFSIKQKKMQKPAMLFEDDTINTRGLFIHDGILRVTNDLTVKSNPPIETLDTKAYAGLNGLDSFNTSTPYPFPVKSCFNLSKSIR